MELPSVQCKKCKHNVLNSPDRDLQRRCKHYQAATNADRIRSMSDEELAEYLYSRGNDSEYCYGICAFQDECEEWKSREFCIEHIVEWLKQEVNK